VDTSTDPPTTNTTVVTNYSNVNVSATFAYETNFLLLQFMDNGTKPDLARGDGTFTTNLITPASLVSTSIVLNFTVTGTDLTQTNDTGTIEVGFTNQFAVTYKLFPRPLNDKLTNAYKITAAGGLVTGTNNFASMEPGEPQHAKIATVDGSVWWTWSSPVNTNVLVDTAGSSFNPALAIYTNNAPTNSIKTLKLVTESADDAANKLKAHVNFDAIAGVTYRIVVAGQDSTNGFGNIRLRVVPGGQPDTSPPVVSITRPKKRRSVRRKTSPFAALSRNRSSMTRVSATWSCRSTAWRPPTSSCPAIPGALPFSCLWEPIWCGRMPSIMPAMSEWPIRLSFVTSVPPTTFLPAPGYCPEWAARLRPTTPRPPWKPGNRCMRATPAATRSGMPGAPRTMAS
jgi:hypothetical protein